MADPMRVLWAKGRVVLCVQTAEGEMRLRMKPELAAAVAQALGAAGNAAWVGAFAVPYVPIEEDRNG